MKNGLGENIWHKSIPGRIASGSEREPESFEYLDEVDIDFASLDINAEPTLDILTVTAVV